jgi:hypothetical protein
MTDAGRTCPMKVHGEHNRSNLRKSESASLVLGYGIPQHGASFEPCSTQTHHLAPPQSKHLPTRGLRASQRRQNTTSPVCTRTLTPGARWRNAIGAARVLSRFADHKGTNIHKDSRWSAPTMKTTMEEAGRCRGARGQTQTATDNNNSYRRRRRMIAYRGAGWRDSWRRG